MNYSSLKVAKALADDVYHFEDTIPEEHSTEGVPASYYSKIYAEQLNPIVLFDLIFRIRMDRILKAAAYEIGNLEFNKKRYFLHRDEPTPRDTSALILPRTSECITILNRMWYTPFSSSEWQPSVLDRFAEDYKVEPSLNQAAALESITQCKTMKRVDHNQNNPLTRFVCGTYNLLLAAPMVGSEMIGSKTAEDYWLELMNPYFELGALADKSRRRESR